MEKFRRFEDRGTGIMPFGPLKPRKCNVALKGMLCLFGVGLLLVRVPLLAILALLHVVFEVVWSLIPIGFVRRPLQLGVNAVIARLALLLFGCWYIPAADCHLPGRRRSTGPTSSVSSGSLLIANHVGYLEILYLQFRYSPVFTVIVDGGDKAGQVVVVSLSEAIAAVDPMYRADPAKSQPLHAVLADAKRKLMGPVVIFPELVTSNGLALLPFLPPVKGLECSDVVDVRDVHVIAFRMNQGMFNPGFVVGSMSEHVMAVLMQINNHLQVLRLPNGDLPVFSSSKKEDGTPQADGTEEWCERLRKTMAAMLGVKCVSVGAETKREFAAAWESDRHGQKP